MNTYNKFTRWALLNLAIVAAAGVLLRYKILFSLPVFDYKNLLHAHSHFAFSGWISLALFIAITAAIANNATISISAYTRLFVTAQIAAFGMLLTFPFMGYKAPSIAFSTLSIFFSYGFTWFAWKDMNRSKLSTIVIAYFKAALLFYTLSSLGAFNLAWLIASKNGDQHWYIGSVYFFLHFQYNGWFLFAILGLFFYQLERLPVLFNKNRSRIIFWLLTVSCVPAFLLSALWMQLPQWLYVITVAAAAIQVFAMALLLQLIAPLYKILYRQLLPATRILWVFALAALTIKFTLQAFSTIPSLSHFAFGYRPVVIGYLHLVFLGFASFFIVGYQLQQQLIPAANVSRTGLALFISGALLNELFLLITGIAAIEYAAVPLINYFLLTAATIMFTGAVLMTGKLWQKQPVACSHLYDPKIKMVH